MTNDDIRMKIAEVEDEIAELEREDTSKHECADFHRGKIDDLRVKLVELQSELED